MKTYPRAHYNHHTETFRTHLHPATGTRMRYHCDVALKLVAKPFGSDITAMSLLPGVTVQNALNLF